MILKLGLSASAMAVAFGTISLIPFLCVACETDRLFGDLIMIYDRLPIFKAALDFAVYVENIVKKDQQIRASFIAHAKWANSYNLLTKLGRV